MRVSDDIELGWISSRTIGSLVKLTPNQLQQLFDQSIRHLEILECWVEEENGQVGMAPRSDVDRGNGLREMFALDRIMKRANYIHRRVGRNFLMSYIYEPASTYCNLRCPPVNRHP